MSSLIKRRTSHIRNYRLRPWFDLSTCVVFILISFIAACVGVQLGNTYNRQQRIQRNDALIKGYLLRVKFEQDIGAGLI